MRKQRAFLVASLVLLLLGISAWQCDKAADTPTAETATECPTCIPCPPCDTSTLEAQLTACETALADCEGPTPPPDEEPVSCKDAIDHVGEFKTVQGLFHCSYHPDVGGQPTFCNCPTPYPNHDFTALIWGDERQKFIDCLGGPPEVVLDKQEFGVKGLIEPYEGKVEIILTECGQLTLIP